MKFEALNHYLTGVAIPVSALRSRKSCGVGEFLDLIPFGQWCQKVGLEVIQLLPVNDSGFQASPYSAVSAFALHPIYVRLEEVGGSDEFTDEIDKFRNTFENLPRVQYEEVLRFKLSILKKVYENRQLEINKSKDIKKWISLNPWIKPYCIFHLLKEENNQKHWCEWSALREPKKGDIEKYWKKYSEQAMYYCWVQFVLECQFKKAVDAINKMGVFLKGDIPILMSEDSVDVWANRDYFFFTLRAGAPPDMFSADGQNWGFPIYNWEALKKDNYSFWRERLKQADKFYHLYRIDHVLGFFRIWSIPSSERSGRLGHFYPYPNITTQQLLEAGFDNSRLRWLILPHIYGGEINIALGENSHKIKEKYLNRIGEENLFNFKPEFESENKIYDLDEKENIKNQLLDWYYDKTLLVVNKDEYQKVWDYLKTRAYQSLNDNEKEILSSIIKENEKKADILWEALGRELLSMMKETTGMLVCAEDLGVVPDCVPVVLEDLKILSLKIERWAKKYKEPGQPYIPGSDYPVLSVCTPSVHDTSTVREWWEEELSEEERAQYYASLKKGGLCPKTYTVELAEAILKKNIDASSLLVVFQMQEFFSLTEDTRVLYPQDERINIPGTLSPENWTYRIYSEIEKINDETELNSKIKNLTQIRIQREVK